VKKLAENERDPQKKADLWIRAGKLLEDSGDKDRAIAKYKLALDADAKSLAAFGALRAIYADRGDAHGAVDLLEREISATDGPIAKATLWAELGQMARERLGERGKARDAFTKSLELDRRRRRRRAGSARWPSPIRTRRDDEVPRAAPRAHERDGSEVCA